VVVLTARGDEHAFMRCVQAGVSGYLPKPFQLADLISTCNKVLAATLNGPPKDSERRRLPRRDLMVKVRVIADQKTPVALGELVNISTGGAQVNLVAELQPGSRVRVALHIASGGEGIKFEGRIQWRAAAADGFAHGVEFVDLDDPTRQRLERLFRPAA
jgi:CheY-like chemotaxis protein